MNFRPSSQFRKTILADGYSAKDLRQLRIESFGQRSLGQPLSADDGDSFRLYDTIADSSSDWMDTLDSQLDSEQFCGSLTSEQQDLIHLLQDGFKISEIMDILDISERDIRLMACEIARQRRKFDAEF